MKRLLLILILVTSLRIQAQEFKFNVTIDATSIRGSNKQVFKTLEKAMEEFINKNRWTDKRFQNYEKIKGDIILNVKKYDNKDNQITAELYFRSYRPVFNSDYETLLINLVDKNFVFTYREFEKLDFNLELYDGNLTSTLAFYLYVALGYDFNSFKEGAGKPFFEKANVIQTNAEQNGVKGWAKENKNNSKGDLIEELLNEESVFYHKAIYTYHRWGLDEMSEHPKRGKSNIIAAINYLNRFNQDNKNGNFLTKIFFDTKADEIVQIFTSGPPTNTNFVILKLRGLAPNYDFKWDEISKTGKIGGGRNNRFGGPPRGGKDRIMDEGKQKEQRKELKEKRY